MATIKKEVCDRCGEPIQTIGWTSKLSRKQPCKIDLLKLFNGNLDGYSYSEEQYDLCCECTRKLSLFLRNECDITNNNEEQS